MLSRRSPFVGTPPPNWKSIRTVKPVTVNVPAQSSQYYSPKWPQHVVDTDMRSAQYLNDMTDAVLALQDLVKDLQDPIDSLVDKIQALQERLDLLEDEIES